MQEKKIKIPIYGGRLILIKDINFDKTNKKYKLEIPSNWNAAACDRNSEKYGVDYFIVILEDKLKLSVVAHECLHLTNYLFLNRGIKFDLENDEAHAILLEWIFEQAEKFYVEKS